MTEFLNLDYKKLFRTQAEKELWHLESKSGTYDEVTELWQIIVENKEIVKRLDNLIKSFNEDLDTKESFLHNDYHDYEVLEILEKLKGVQK